MIRSLRVQIRGLLPQFVSELVPAQATVAPLRIERREKGVAIEDGQGFHRANIRADLLMWEVTIRSAQSIPATRVSWPNHR